MIPFGFSDTTDPTIETFTPAYADFTFRYTGFAEYGHTMTLDEILASEGSRFYRYSGEVDDASGGESDGDFSLERLWIASDNALVERVDAEMAMDNCYDQITLLRTPFVEGGQFTQTVTTADGATHDLVTTIDRLVETPEGWEITVTYREDGGAIYEKRTFREDTGLIFYERMLPNEDAEILLNYSYLETFSGLGEMAFTDVPKDHSTRITLEKRRALGQISGYPDGSFRPDAPATEAETLVMAYADHQLPAVEAGASWFAPYLILAGEDGRTDVVPGRQMTAGHFSEWFGHAFADKEEDQILTRAEVAALTFDPPQPFDNTEARESLVASELAQSSLDRPLLYRETPKHGFFRWEEQAEDALGTYRADFIVHDVGVQIFDPVRQTEEGRSGDGYSVLTAANLTQAQRLELENLKRRSGVHLLSHDGERAIYTISLGEKPTGGYQIRPVTLHGGTLLVSLQSPGPDDLVTQALTYPTLIVEITPARSDLTVITTSGERLPRNPAEPTL
jgi:hypothetical protein